VEFVYNKGVPIFMLLSGDKYDYREFGVPTFHVFLVTFGSFLSVYIFHLLCSEFSKIKLLYFFMSILPSVLIINRGMLMIVLTSCLFVYLMSMRRMSLAKFAGVLSTTAIVLYLFGIMGNIRLTQGQRISSEVILELSEASDSFNESIIPNPYIWSYIYISSPAANLQNTINKAPNSDFDFIAFLNFEIVPDFISKRLANVFDLERKFPILIAPWLTVATIYAPAYMYMGWAGIIMMFCFFTVTTVLYVAIVKKTSRYHVTGVAILSTLVLYNTFDNMYYFSGLNLQLVYPIIFSMMRSLNIKSLSNVSYE
jgi:hypothetical protein